MAETGLFSLLGFASLLFGYILGSIPFGLILTRYAGLGDVRSIGSGNIGATNVLRTGNKKLAAATLLLDVLKGTAAVLIAARYGEYAAIAAGLGAFIGHLFPVWIGFKGGKGVATYLGILLGLAWQGALVFAAAWIITALLTRYSSLSAMIASLITPIALYARGDTVDAALMALLTIIIFITHRANISRLLDGSESKIGAKGLKRRRIFDLEFVSLIISGSTGCALYVPIILVLPPFVIWFFSAGRRPMRLNACQNLIFVAAVRAHFASCPWKTLSVK